MKKAKEVVFINHIGRNARGKRYTIETLAKLKTVERHNNHDYCEEEAKKLDSDIDLSQKHLNRQYIIKDGRLVEIQGHLTITDNVRKVYDEIERLNKQAGKLPLKAENYFKRLCRYKGRQIAVEEILQIGNCHDWKGLSIDARIRMGKILLATFLDMVQMLCRSDAQFLVVGVSLHLNEKTPHLHIVGVPLFYNPQAKDGYVYRVQKSAIFNDLTLGPILQDHAREFALNLVRQEFGWEFKPKEPGRNIDLKKFEYIYQIFQQQIEQGEAFLKALKDCRNKRKDHAQCYEGLNTRIRRCETFAIQRDELLNSIPFVYRKKVATCLEQLLTEREEDAACMRQAQSAISDLFRLIELNPVHDLDEKIQNAEAVKNRRLSLEEIVRNAEEKSTAR